MRGGGGKRRVVRLEGPDQRSAVCFFPAVFILKGENGAGKGKFRLFDTILGGEYMREGPVQLRRDDKLRVESGLSGKERGRFPAHYRELLGRHPFKRLPQIFRMVEPDRHYKAEPDVAQDV